MRTPFFVLALAASSLVHPAAAQIDSDLLAGISARSIGPAAMSGRVAEVTGVDAAVAAAGDALVELRAPKLGMSRASGYEGEGWAIVRSPTTEGAKQALLALIQNVQVRYA